MIFFFLQDRNVNMPSLTHLKEMHDSKEKQVTLQVNLQHITYQLG